MVVKSDFNAHMFKKAFPLFQQPENRGLIYLDNAATTQKPDCVIEAITAFYYHANANAHRASHRLARKATQMVESTRAKAAQFLGAASPDEVVFCRGATEALNLLAASLGDSLVSGDEIILSYAEHHANIVPWQMVAERTGAQLKYLPSEKRQGPNSIMGRPEVNALEALITNRTRMVSITAASNVLGFKVDLQAIRRILDRCQAQGVVDRPIVFIVDASQQAAHESLEVEQIGCDFLVCSAHKFYGPTGIGLLYGRRDVLHALPPWQGGGEMIERVGLMRSDYASGVHRFEAGTSSLAGLAGLSRCFDFLEALDRVAVAEHEQRVTRYLHDALSAMPEVVLLTQPENNVGIVTWVPCEGVHIQDIAYWLDERDIAVRVGRHCAEPLMNELTYSATLRASIGAYTTLEEAEQFVVALKEGVRQLRQAPNQGAGARSDHSSEGAASPLGSDAMSGDLSDSLDPPLDHPSDHLEGLNMDDLRAVKHWQARYRTLLKWGHAVVRKPQLRGEAHRLRGCEADAWMDVVVDQQGRYQVYIDSDSRVVRGLAALVLVLVNHKTSDEIKAVDLEAVFAELGLSKHLSQSRSNGFQVMVARLYEFVSA